MFKLKNQGSKQASTGPSTKLGTHRTVKRALKHEMTTNITQTTSNRETKACKLILYIPVQNRKDTYMAAEKLNISWRSVNTVLKQQMPLSVETAPASMWNQMGSQGSKAIEASPVHLAVTQHKLLSLPYLQGNSRLISPQTAFKVKYNKIQ